MIELDPASSEGPSAQIVAQVVGHIESGRFSPGEGLPTVRGLAATLGVAPNTVAKAYRELESAGWVETRGRRGTVVRTPSGDVAALDTAADTFVAACRRAGVDVDQACTLLRRRW